MVSNSMVKLQLERISQTRLTNSKRRNKMLEKNNKMISEITELVTKVKSELANEINKQQYLYIGIQERLLYLTKMNLIIDQNMVKKF